MEEREERDENEEGKEEPWKRGKVKTEQRGREMTDKVETEKPSKKISKASEASFLRCVAFPLFHVSFFPSLLFIPFFPLFNGSFFAS